MRGNVYRGTSLSAAREGELAGTVHGSQFDVVEGFMDPEDIQKDHTGKHIEELPWEVGPKITTTGVVGGFSDRLGVATSFASGNVPLVFHMDESDLPHLVQNRYSYDFYDSVKGSLPWVDGTAGGELRINESLEGLVNPAEENRTIRYYGDGLRSRAMMYDDEMEYLATGQEEVDIDGAIRAAASYIRRPKAYLQKIGDYATSESLAYDGETIIGGWSDEKAMRQFYAEVTEHLPDWLDYYGVLVDTHLVHESWGYNEGRVRAVYGPNGSSEARDYPDWLLGD